MIANLLNSLPNTQDAERFEDILKVPGCRVERIVSFGQTSPADFWYDQSWDEWVLVLSGEALLQLEDRSEPVRLLAGDHLLIPARLRHRVAFTSPDEPTIWLALHIGETSSEATADVQT
ncbi:cupin 2 domain-containing protein [Azomonas agilis]|uniref:Cupin 2 domain-containing protein n=1 Tax=Azomonas agilis TaxID=116849 RepID=A0A562J0B5_9GAMM|nr:cupin domain-containing protein [Azomonas agilis]TWH76719.1 cupin 2 domain-containing protein [Azomonas agilis]